MFRGDDSLELHRAVLATLDALVLVLDPHGRILAFNRYCEALTGYTEEEVLGREVFGLFVPREEEARVREICRGLLEGGSPCTHENHWTTKGGERRLIRWSNSALLDGGGKVTHVIGTGLDVTDSRRAEADREEQIRLLELTADVGRALTRDAPLDESLQWCAQAIADHLGAAFVRIWTLNDTANILELRASAGMYTHLDGAHGRVPQKDVKIWQILRGGQALVTNQVVGDPAVSDQEWARREGMRAFAGHPVRVEGEAVGVVALFSREPLSMAAQAALASVADLIALGISRRQVEERLQFTRFSVDHSQEAAFWLDSEGRLVDVNETACRSVGYQREELLQMHVWDIDPDFSPERWSAVWRELRDRGSHTMETRHRTKEGRFFPVEVQANHVAFRGREYDCAFVRDISERRRAEETLRQREDLLRATLDSTADGILVVDPDGRISTHNSRFAEMWGLSPEVMARARTRWDLFGAVQDQLADPAAGRASLQAIERVQEEVRDELRLADGRVFERVVRPLVRGGQSSGMVISVSDVSARRRAERERTILEEQLRQSQKMEAVGRLAGGVAHDFNNLLTGIIGYAEVIASELEPGDPIRADAEEIRNAGERAAQLTSQLLTFSRKQVIAPQVVDLNRVLAESRRMLGRIIGEDIELVFSPGVDLPAVKIDPGQVDQVLVNLATNSRDAMAGGGRLVIETRRMDVGEAELRCRPGLRPGSYVLLQVQDNGVGMDAQTLEHAFEPFFSTKPKDRGTGLGLSTVYGIVKQNDGFAYLHSSPGHGTTVEVLFPPTREAAPQATVRRQHKVAHGRETVLLVEDEDTVRSLATRILRRHGYEVVAASDAEEGLRLWEEHREAIGLLVTDVVLPKMNGRALFDRLHSERADLKALFISGYNDEVVSERGVLTEGFHFLPKPFTVEGFAAKVREVLDT